MRAVPGGTWVPSPHLPGTAVPGFTNPAPAGLVLCRVRFYAYPGGRTSTGDRLARAQLPRSLRPAACKSIRFGGN